MIGERTSWDFLKIGCQNRWCWRRWCWRWWCWSRWCWSRWCWSRWCWSWCQPAGDFFCHSIHQGVHKLTGQQGFLLCYLCMGLSFSYWSGIHRNLRKAVKSKRRRSNAVPDRKYGRWMPKQRFNVNQVPLPFVFEQDRTYDFSGSKQIWVSQPGSGLDKRQATLQLCI